MNSIQRLMNFFISLAMILGSILMIINPEKGYVVITVILSLGLVFSGIGSILYYFKMARHMVGGKIIFIRGIIVFDLGLFTYSISDIPKIYVLMYLLIIHGFSGLVEILRAIEGKNNGQKRWKLKLSHGVLDFSLALVCLFVIHSVQFTVMIYCFGVFYSALVRMASAFRKTEIVYIQ